MVITYRCRRSGGIDTSSDRKDKITGDEVKDGLSRYVIAALFNTENVDAVEFVTAYEESIRENNREFRIVRDMKALGTRVLMRMNKTRRNIQQKTLDLRLPSQRFFLWKYKQ